MKKNPEPAKKPKIPEDSAVARLREQFQKRKSNIKPSKEMDEIIRKTPNAEEIPLQKIARPRRNRDIDLAGLVRKSVYKTRGERS
jgi:hypothetical protein